eukprot:9023974-Karenia_brevis.AAC.1
MESDVVLDVVVRRCSIIIKSIACKKEALLIGRDALLVLDFAFNTRNGIRSANVQRAGHARHCFDKDLQAFTARREIH